MNRVIILLFLIGTATSLQSQIRATFSNNLKIEFIYGDEAYARQEVLFEVKNNMVIGKITYPNTDKILSSEVELNDEQINTINSFISLVDKYKNDNCAEKQVSSYVQYYNISKDIETIEIRRFCDWKNLKFFDIKHLIFEKYLKLLEAKKDSLNLEYFKMLKGKWQENTPLDKLSLTAVCSLTKIDQGSDTKEFIEFSELNKIVIVRNDRKIYYNYNLEFEGNNTYLSLDPYQNGVEFIYGHSFLINKSDNNKMKLSRGFP